MNMTNLNTDQQNAAIQILDFLLDPNARELAISGPAGSGKTYLLQYLFDRIMPMYRDTCNWASIPETINNIVFTATTNRAADVLTATMGQEAKTIHSFMNLRVYDDYSTGKQRIQKTKNFTVHMNTLIVIDEASMIDRELHKILIDGTNSSCKIIYVGDHCQMAPVGESLSVVWNQNIPRINLTIQMRNAGQPALMNLCEQMRYTVESGIFLPITLVPGVIEVLDDDEMRNHVNRVFLPVENNSKIMTYTNKTAKQFNDYIRAIRGNYARYDTGEVVINNRSIDLGSGEMLYAENAYLVKRDTNLKDEIMTIDGMDIVYYKIQLTSLKNNFKLTVNQPDDPEFFGEVIKYLRKNKDWPNFYRLHNTFPDLRLRDSSTVYKSQGATYDSVYIDLDDIGSSNIKDQVARMLYVSVSRPRNRIYFYGQLPAKYLGG